MRGAEPHRGDRRPVARRSRRVAWTVGALVVVLLALAAAAYRLDLLARWTATAPPAAPDPTREPAAVPPPPGLELPDPAPARGVASPLTPTTGPGAADLDPRAVRRALDRLLDSRRLGSRVAVAVSGLDGRPAYEVGPRTFIPASTLKLLTSLAALSAIGPEHRFETRAVRSGRVLTLVGGGDPLLASRPPELGEQPDQADLITLARQTARRLTAEGRTRVRLHYDDTLFAGPAVSPAWKPDYLTDDVVSPITALWVDQGRETPGYTARSADPAAAAARAFAAALRARGVRVAGEPERRPAAEDAEPVAAVLGAELVEVVQHVLEASDNEAAEVLARHVALAVGRPASFDGGSAALRSVVGDLGVRLRGAVVRDGSGLSRDNRLSARTLLEAMAVGADPGRPELGGLLEGLPVAGFSGSLASRFTVRADAGLGFVRAKTGTLNGVHGLAGVTVGSDGAAMFFVAVANRVALRNTLFARAQLDRVAAALTACRCAAR